MNKIIILILILLLSISVLSFNHKNSNLVSNTFSESTDELMFSIDGIVNREYYLPFSEGYEKIWTEAYYKKLKDLNYDYSADIRIEIPDTLAEKMFKIKIGYHVLAFDSSQLKYTDKILNFYSKTIEGCGTLVYFRTVNNSKLSRLNVIAKSDSVQKFLSKKIVFDEVINVEVEYIEENVFQYFDKNREELRDQIVHWSNEVDPTVNNKPMMQQIREIFSIKCLKMNLINKETIHDYIVLGKDKKYGYSFTAIVFGGINKVALKTHTRFDQVIKFKDKFYFLLYGYKPETGLRGYFIYEIEGNQLKQVFGDISYST